MTCYFSVSELENALAALSAQIPGFHADLILLGRLTRFLDTHIVTQLNECLRQHGLSESLWHAVLAIYAQPDHQILPSRLSEILKLTRTSATRLSDELVACGWVERHSHTHDRRKITLKLTASGEELVRRVSPDTNDTRRQLWSALSCEEKRQLRYLLEKVLNQQPVAASVCRNDTDDTTQTAHP